MCAYTEELGMFFQQIKFSTNYVLQSSEKEWTHYHMKIFTSVDVDFYPPKFEFSN